MTRFYAASARWRVGIGGEPSVLLVISGGTALECKSPGANRTLPTASRRLAGETMLYPSTPPGADLGRWVAAMIGASDGVPSTSRSSTCWLIPRSAFERRST